MSEYHIIRAHLVYNELIPERLLIRLARARTLKELRSFLPTPAYGPEMASVHEDTSKEYIIAFTRVLQKRILKLYEGPDENIQKLLDSYFRKYFYEEKSWQIKEKILGKKMIKPYFPSLVHEKIEVDIPSDIITLATKHSNTLIIDTYLYKLYLQQLHETINTTPRTFRKELETLLKLETDYHNTIIHQVFRKNKNLLQILQYQNERTRPQKEIDTDPLQNLYRKLKTWSKDIIKNYYINPLYVIATAILAEIEWKNLQIVTRAIEVNLPSQITLKLLI